MQFTALRQPSGATASVAAGVLCCASTKCNVHYVLLLLFLFSLALR